MNRKSWSTVGALCLILAGGCSPEDEGTAVDAGRDHAGDPASSDESGDDTAVNGGNGNAGNGNGGNGGDVEPTGGENDACATVRCAGGTHCQVTEVECVQAPCKPVVECVADDVSGCELIDCKPSDICVEDASGAGSCVPNKGEPSCNLQCVKGKHCESVDVTCVKPPCDPVQECVDDDACTGFVCEPGKHCALLATPCAQKPGLLPPMCEPQPACVPDVKCGTNTCTGGQECCNASCGICADPGVSCIQIAC